MFDYTDFWSMSVLHDVSRIHNFTEEVSVRDRIATLARDSEKTRVICVWETLYPQLY